MAYRKYIKGGVIRTARVIKVEKLEDKGGVHEEIVHKVLRMSILLHLL